MTDAVPNATNAKLVYNGGPVLQNVKVVTVFWGNNVQFSGTGTQSLNAFYTAVVQSAYYDWLQEYNTTSPAQKIGRGTFGGSYAYTAGATGTLQDSAIQTALGKLIDNGSVPAPDANTLYAIHFAPGINIKMSNGDASCVVFCAYHSSFAHGGKNVYYSINPDQGGSCAGGCGGDPSLFNNATSVASHELVEATTDADVGQNNIAWYDQTNGEIGDICNAQQGTIAGYTVQKEWSNTYPTASGSCIVTNPKVMVNDFTIAATPTTPIDVPQGGMATVMIAMTKSVGTGETATLKATAPTNVTGTFSPASASTDGGKSTLTISAAATATLGMGKVTVSAAATSTTHTVDVQINVVAPPDMAMEPDMAQPAGGGNGGNGGGGNGGNGGGGSGGTGTGGNGNGGGNGNNGGGGGDSGCSMSGGSIAGSWAFAGILLLALAFRRRRA